MYYFQFNLLSKVIPGTGCLPIRRWSIRRCTTMQNLSLFFSKNHDYFCGKQKKSLSTMQLLYQVFFTMHMLWLILLGFLLCILLSYLQRGKHPFYFKDLPEYDPVFPYILVAAFFFCQRKLQPFFSRHFKDFFCSF